MMRIMRSLLLRALFASLLIAGVLGGYGQFSSSQKKGLFTTYKANYRKSYANSTYENRRYQNFLNNLQLIDIRNANDPNKVHGITRFADMTQEEFRAKYLGFKGKRSGSSSLLAAFQEAGITVNDVTAQYTRAAEEKSLEAISSVDWTGASGGTALVGAIKDQGGCGSCWAFAAVNQIEADSVRTLGNPTSQILSAQQVTSCAINPYNAADGMGCGGGWTDAALSYVMTAGGLVLDSVYPYASGVSGVTYSCTNSLLTAANKKVTVTAINTITLNEAAMGQYVLTTGPLAIYVDATNWNSYNGGIMTQCNAAGTAISLNHAVQAVGVYIDSTGATPSYWKVRNQWGTSWGESGYIRFKYGTNACGHAEDPFYASVANVGTVPTATTTRVPTASPPTRSPTRSPTKSPSRSPTRSPTRRPAAASLAPTLKSPTRSPTASTVAPTASTVVPTSRKPSIVPSKAPQSPTLAPITSIPTVQPVTAAPTSASIYPTSAAPIVGAVSNFCAAYSATNTNSALSNTVPCYFTASPGTQVTVSACNTGNPNSCTSTDQYIQIFDSASNVMVAFDDDADTTLFPNCGLCSAIAFTVPTDGATHTYRIDQGCYSTVTCSGQFLVTGGTITTYTELPTARTVAPTRRVPTKTPTRRPNTSPVATTRVPTAPFTVTTRLPTPVRTAAPTQTSSSTTTTCTPFSTSNGGSVSCTVNACPGSSISASLCGYNGATCNGDTQLTLLNTLGNQVAYDDDFCSLCSSFTYTVRSSDTGGGCGDFTIKQSCYSTTSCSGTTKVVVTPPVTLPAFSLTSGQVAVPFQVCSTGPLKTVTIQNRAGTCVGDQVVAVYNSAGTTQYAYNDDVCTTGDIACQCAATSIGQTGTGCLSYQLIESCYPAGVTSGYSGYPCGGQFQLIGV